MESSKVKLPKLAIEAIELLKAKGMPLHEIGLNKATAQLPLVNGWEELLKVPNDVLFQALYYGYEMYQTSEDKVRELYDEYKTNEQKARVRNDTDAEERLQLAAFAIRETLDALNIKIKGVNDHE